MKILVSVLLSVVLAFAVADPATQTDLNPAVAVSVEIDTPLQEIGYGKVFALRCVVEGLTEPYFVQWQYSEDCVEWIDILCNEEVYSFILTEENAKLFYRVAIFKYD